MTSETSESGREFSNPAFKGAYEKGFMAALSGAKDRSDCPYDPDNYGPQGVTFSRAFHRHWHQGYDDGERSLQAGGD